MPKRLGIIPQLYAQPLFEGLRRAVTAKEIDAELTEDVPARLAIQLREEQLHGAFLSPIDYARDYAKYKILPGVGVASEGESGAVHLVFNEQLKRIRSIAVDPGCASEIVLTHIILAEKYEIVPQFVPIKSSVEESLANVDAALIVNRTSQLPFAGSNKIDLVDEWLDLTELPYVHGCRASREHALSSNEMRTIAAQAASASKLEGKLLNHAGYLLNFGYDLNEEALAGLTEFYRMAYYHGILKDIPEPRFHSLSGIRTSSPSIN